MAQFIELHQVDPGIRTMMINTDFIVLFQPSVHADGGTEIIVKDGMVSVDIESGYQSYTVGYRVSETYAQVKRLLDILAKR